MEHDLHTLHPDLRASIELFYDPYNLNCTNLSKEAESAEYGAYQFELNKRLALFRVAKTTPTKVGQFVTIWNRNEKGITQPYDISDPIEFFIIATRKDNKFGQFVFPKNILCEKDIVSKNRKGGKRGIRVYPPWDKTANKQAQKTQTWQLKYFISIPTNEDTDKNRVQILFNCAFNNSGDLS